jgi:hypothetical protein
MTTRVTTGEVRTSYFSALQSRKNEMNGKDDIQHPDPHPQDRHGHLERHEGCGQRGAD